MTLGSRFKRIISTVTNQPPPYDPDKDHDVGATSGKKYLIDYDETRRTSRGSISFDERHRPSTEIRVGRPMSPRNLSVSAAAQPRSVSPGTIHAALSDAGVRGGSISSMGNGSSMRGGSVASVGSMSSEASDDGSNGGEGGEGGPDDASGRRGSAAVVNGQIVNIRRSSLTQRQVKPDGLRCQICKELLTYDSGHKLNPLDNGLFCNVCVSALRHTDPKSFRVYTIDPSTSAETPAPERKSSVKDRRKSSTGSGSSAKSNGTPLKKSVSLSETGPMPDPNVLFDLKIVRPFHLGGYFPVRCSRCGDGFEICHDRYAGARCTICKDPIWDLCGTCLAKPENGAYLQLLRHKEAVHADYGSKEDEPGEESKEPKAEGEAAKAEGKEEAKQTNGVGPSTVMAADDDDEDIDPMDESHMAKTNGDASGSNKSAEKEGGRKVMEWILYQPPGRVIGPAWRVAAMRNSV